MGTLPDRECWSIDIEKSSLSFSLRHALLGKRRLSHEQAAQSEQRADVLRSKTLDIA